MHTNKLKQKRENIFRPPTSPLGVNFSHAVQNLAPTEHSDVKQALKKCVSAPTSATGCHHHGNWCQTASEWNFRCELGVGRWRGLNQACMQHTVPAWELLWSNQT